MRADYSEDSTQVSRPATVIKFETVVALRNAAGWTNAALARRMGMDQSAVKRLLAGELRPSNASIAGFILAFRERFPKIAFEDLFTTVRAGEAPPAVEDEEPQAESA